VELVLSRGYERRVEPLGLSSGAQSHDYIDGKRALAHGQDLKLVAEAILELVNEQGVSFDAVGGLTMGADPIAHAIALLSGKKWFTVRKEAKSHGKLSGVEGAELVPGAKVILVDDVVTTGRSILAAREAIVDKQVEVVLAVALVDRGKSARERLLERGIDFRPLLTYEDLGIDPVGA
jgi:orotate phosphoribosyltransferase